MGCPPSSSRNQCWCAHTSELSCATKMGTSPISPTPRSAAYARSARHWRSKVNCSNSKNATSSASACARDGQGAGLVPGKLAVPAGPDRAAVSVLDRHEQRVVVEPEARCAARNAASSIGKPGELLAETTKGAPQYRRTQLAGGVVVARAPGSARWRSPWARAALRRPGCAG